MASELYCCKRDGANSDSNSDLGTVMGGTVRVSSDNMSVVFALVAGAARDPLLMDLLWCLHFFTAHSQIYIEVNHIAGVDNTTADALSHNKLHSCSTQAAAAPSPIPHTLLDVLLHTQPDWISPSWRRMFLCILGKH